MRIVQLNPYYYPYKGGIERRLHEICRRLSKKHEMILLTSQLKDTELEEEMDGYTIKRLPSKFYTNYNPPHVSTPGVLQALNDLEPDLVDFHYRWAPSYTKAMKSYGGKWVFTFHNTYGEGQGPMRYLSTMNDFFFCQMIRDKNVICVSDFVKNDLISRDFKEENLDVIPTGVDFVTDSGKDENFILFVGRLVKTKGLSTLIEAMKNVDCKLVIAGTGPEEELLRSMVGKYDLTDKVEFTGYVDEETKTRLMTTCSAFVMPSVFESLGLAAEEALAHCKPVIASRVGGLPEVVGNAGILIPPKEPQALSDAINAVMVDKELRDNLISNTKTQIQKYNWDNIVNDLEAVYLKNIENNSQS